MLQSLFHKYFSLMISLNKKNLKKKITRDFQKLEINYKLQRQLVKKSKLQAMNLLVTRHLKVTNKVNMKKKNKIIYKVILYWLNLKSKKCNSQQQTKKLKLNRKTLVRKCSANYILYKSLTNYKKTQKRSKKQKNNHQIRLTN